MNQDSHRDMNMLHGESLLWYVCTLVLPCSLHTNKCTLSQQCQLGSVSYKMSFTLCVMLSGNFISNETMRSPFRLGSLGNGSPWPWIRFTVVGFTISFIRLIGIFSPLSVGTLMIEPHNAWNKNTTINFCFTPLIYRLPDYTEATLLCMTLELFVTCSSSTYFLYPVQSVHTNVGNDNLPCFGLAGMNQWGGSNVVFPPSKASVQPVFSHILPTFQRLSILVTVIHCGWCGNIPNKFSHTQSEFNTSTWHTITSPGTNGVPLYNNQVIQ
jgi:hypothetical protein